MTRCGFVYAFSIAPPLSHTNMATYASKIQTKNPNKNVNTDLKQRDVPSIYSLFFDYLIVMSSYSLESRFQEPSSARAKDLMLIRNCLL